DDRAGVVVSRARHESLAELVVHGVEHDQTACRRTALTGVRERGGKRPLDGALEVGVIADDERVLTTELEHDLRQAAAGVLVDPAARRRRPREADEVDVRMLDERRTGFARSLNDAQDA